MKHVHRVAAVIHDEIRLKIQCLVDVHVIFLCRAAMGCKDMNPRLCKGSRHIILGGEGIASRDRHLGTGMMEHLSHIGRLCLQMKGYDNLLSCKGLCLRIFLVDRCHDRHEILYPVDLVVPGGGKLDIANH